MSSSPAAAASRPVSGDDGSLRRFLRCGHVLSSALRELLEERFLRQLEPGGLTPAQFCFLKLITLNPDLQVGEVARRLNVSPAATSKVVDRLERLGLVSRGASAEDRRATLVSASAAGRGMVREYEELKATYIGPVISSLGPDGLERLCELLEQVCVGLLRDDAGAPTICLRCAGYYESDCLLARSPEQCGFRSRGCSRAESQA
jgi:DNA-binding MarR family transcriptional regulator